MKQFFTKNTLEASVWCEPCRKKTQWKIHKGLPQYCIPCFEKLEAQHNEPKPEAPAEQSGFDFTGKVSGR